ncbi:MAG TPA: hypothetical protein GX704_03095 [Clostridiales bacterium]|jgi:chromosome segregation ATPase|nr:hypothetical protein [Clostridiales bacterium]
MNNNEYQQNQQPPKPAPTQQGEAFRSSMFGYNKEDVDSYFTAMANELNRLKSELEASKTGSNDAVYEISRRLDEKIAEFDALTQKYSELESDYSALEDKLSESERQIEEAGQQLLEKDGEIEALRLRVEENRQVMNNTLTEAEEKARQYDAVSAKIGSLIINATKDAEDIRINAENEAVALKNQAEEDANGIRAEAAREAEDFLNFARNNVRSSADEANRLVGEYAVRAAENWKALLGESQNRMSELIKELEAGINENVSAVSEEFGGYKESLVRSITMAEKTMQEADTECAKEFEEQ